MFQPLNGSAVVESNLKIHSLDINSSSMDGWILIREFNHTYLPFSFSLSFSNVVLVVHL